MKQNEKQDISLYLPLDISFLPVAVSFVENAAVALGLPPGRAMALTLATEEIFVYLSQITLPDQTAVIRCSSGGYFVRTDFSFSATDFNMRAFNLTSSVSPDDEASLEEMGLLIASRSVDRFKVSEERGEGLRLTLIKEKSYPLLEDERVSLPKPLKDWTLRAPDPEEIKLMVGMAHQCYPLHLLPNAFGFPGKVVDMVESGDYRVLLASDPAGSPGGAILWHWAGARTIECFGPYLFNQAPDSPMAGELLEGCLGAIAKSHAVGLICRLPTEELPGEHFEPLGIWDLFDAEGSPHALTAYFRQMQEDPGASVWAHPELEPFLRGEYERLVLPREIRLLTDAGEGKREFSVLSADFDRLQGLVTLYPVRTGEDIEENLVDHLKLLKKESIYGIYFEMDLGTSWHPQFTPALLKNGFTPRLVLPYAGKGDIVIFQSGGRSS